MSDTQLKMATKIKPLKDEFYGDWIGAIQRPPVLELDMGNCWQPDNTFYTLRRDKQKISPMQTEIGSKVERTSDSFSYHHLASNSAVLQT